LDISKDIKKVKIQRYIHMCAHTHTHTHTYIHTHIYIHNTYIYIKILAESEFKNLPIATSF
jgi:hypothetical protein